MRINYDRLKQLNIEALSYTNESSTNVHGDNNNVAINPNFHEPLLCFNLVHRIVEDIIRGEQISEAALNLVLDLGVVETGQEVRKNIVEPFNMVG